MTDYVRDALRRAIEEWASYRELRPRYKARGMEGREYLGIETSDSALTLYEMAKFSEHHGHPYYVIRALFEDRHEAFLENGRHVIYWPDIEAEPATEGEATR